MSKTKTKTKNVKAFSQLEKSDCVETPIVIWVASDFDRLPPDMLARVMGALNRELGAPVVSVSVSAGDKIVY